MARAHILVVDDETTILSTLKKKLTLEDYAVDVAGGFRLAHKKLARYNYDLALFDVALPDGNGVDLLAQVRNAGNEMPVLMMSGHATVDTAVTATKLGASDFLEKPISTDRLLLVVENTLRLVRAEAEAKTLRSQAGLGDDLLGDSAPMADLRALIARAAKARATVVIRGERGTGKELVARAIHRESKRARGPLEKLNCAAVPHDLIESELFGHEAGAFTGATKQRRGKFERANGGTLFLDEVGDMPLAMQAKLLRVLQENEIERVGGTETLKVDVRVVAATNRDLEKLCEQDAFRADLYDRLNVLPLYIPPLRARREDVPLLARHFLAIAATSNDRPDITISDAALTELTRYSFPGNVRELRNIIERLVIVTPDDTIDKADVDNCLGSGLGPQKKGLYRPGVPLRVMMEEHERTIVEEALRHHDGKMANTARALGLERSHLYKKCKALGIRD
ncbi:MAG TPA: sigma-54-dependent Fis family transcriptional regulator [Sorangium sp.]|nr:sigma-54-dependent Fis family transcriptional regulator [Sorangium sp.]